MKNQKDGLPTGVPTSVFTHANFATLNLHEAIFWETFETHTNEGGAKDPVDVFENSSAIFKEIWPHCDFVQIQIVEC